MFGSHKSILDQIESQAIRQIELNTVGRRWWWFICFMFHRSKKRLNIYLWGKNFIVSLTVWEGATYYWKKTFVKLIFSSYDYIYFVYYIPISIIKKIMINQSVSQLELDKPEWVSFKHVIILGWNLERLRTTRKRKSQKPGSDQKVRVLERAKIGKFWCRIQNWSDCWLIMFSGHFGQS